MAATRTSSVLLVLTLLLMAAAPADLAGAAPRARQLYRWPKHAVTYANRSGYEAEVLAAVAEWNATPADVKLLPAAAGHRADIIAHELGHALGLEHRRDRCSLMAPWSTPLADTCTEGTAPGFIRCGPQPIDVRALIARYGGQIGDFAGTLCPATDA